MDSHSLAPERRRRDRPPDRTEVFGALATDVYDVWDPDSDRPRGLTIALVHGGGWRAADDRSHLAPLAVALTRDGFHVANLEYARIGMPGGGWPGTGATMIAALEAVHGDNELPNRVVAVGHSAGGQLVLWAASGGRATWLHGAIALAPIADLRQADRLGLSQGAPRELLGVAPEEDPRRWAEADPAGQRVDVPTVLLTGHDDAAIPAAVARAWLSNRTPEEVVRSHELMRTGHIDLIDPQHPAYLMLLAEVEELGRG